MEKIFDYYISGHDTDFYRFVAPSSYLKIAETASYAAGERFGFAMDRMISELNATWMTASVDLEILEDINTVGTIQVYAQPFTTNGVLFHETIEIRREEHPIARCAIHTMAVNFLTRKVIRPELVMEHFGKQCSPGQGIPPRLVMPDSMELADTFTVRYSNCDHNQHLRAFTYTDLVCDVADYWSGPERKKGRHLIMEYLGEVRVGETLQLYRADRDDGIFVQGVRPDGKESFKAFLTTE